MTDPVPSKELAEFNAALVTIARRRFTEANRCFSDGVCDCESCTAGQTLVEEIERLNAALTAAAQDAARDASARIALLAENEHYKREAADANQMLESEWFQRVTYKQQLRAALDKLEKPAHEREPPHCSTCSCPPCERRCTCGEREIAPDTVEVRDSFGGLHYPDKQCIAQPPGAE
jgi:hypothetical protein